MGFESVPKFENQDEEQKEKIDPNEDIEVQDLTGKIFFNPELQDEKGRATLREKLRKELTDGMYKKKHPDANIPMKATEGLGTIAKKLYILDIWDKNPKEIGKIFRLRKERLRIKEN